MLKKILPVTLQSFIIKKIINRPLINIFNSTNSKRVLISYITHPFKKQRLVHTNYYEVTTAAKIFHDLGYQVDVVNFQYKYKKIEGYDIIYGFGETLEYFYANKFNVKTKIISYSTGMHQFFQNVQTLQRVKNVQSNKKVWLINSARLTDFSWYRQAIFSDAIITLGNIEVKKTFDPFYKGDLYPLDAPFYKIRDYQKIVKKHSQAHKSYVWFGSSGLVHKGLDLCLEFFKRRPDLLLHVCGPIKNEPEFVALYQDELFHTENIHTHGLVDISSAKFDEILKSSYFAIFPSCSEGGGVSLLTVIGNGAMIPVMTKAASVDMPNAFYINELTVEGIETAVNESQTVYQEQVVRKAQENAEFVIKNNSLDKYRTNLKKIIEQVLDY